MGFRWFGRAVAPSKAALSTQQPLPLFDERFQKKLEYLSIVARRIHRFQERGDRASRKVGSGIAFADHRPYSPGDDFRFIDWQVHARSGRYLVRLHEEEQDLSVYVLVDCSASMGCGRPPKLNYAKQLSAALAYVGLANLDRVSVVAFQDAAIRQLPPLRGRGRIFDVFGFLGDTAAQGATDLASSMKAFVARARRRGVVFLISDLYDPQGFERGLDALRHANFEVVVLQLVDSGDVLPDVHGDMRLVDSETGETRDIAVTDAVLRRYAERAASQRRAIARFCREHSIARFEIDTRTPLEEVVLRVLRDQRL